MISEEEGVHKGYDRFMHILSGLNQVKAKPDNEDVNTKFLRALPPSWQSVCIALKTKGGLDYLSFDELYNKLKTLEVDIKGSSTYSPSPSTIHSTFVGSASNNKVVPADSSTSSVTYITSAPKTQSESTNVME